MRFITSLLASLAITGTAAASPDVTTRAPAPTYSFGVRIGGYGFRHEGSGDWNECRMGGLGVFGHRALRGPLFVEAGLDTYASQPATVTTDLPIDRQSALLSLAAGVRTDLTSWMRGYVQIGAGVELTRVAVPYGDGTTIRDNKALPDGFVGVGADIRLARATYIGASLRTLVMGNFAYDPARLQMANPWVAAPSPNQVFDASPDLAMQGQFYLRHDL
jgi:hypothetical protein